MLGILNASNLNETKTITAQRKQYKSKLVSWKYLRNKYNLSDQKQELLMPKAPLSFHANTQATDGLPHEESVNRGFVTYFLLPRTHCWSNFTCQWSQLFTCYIFQRKHKHILTSYVIPPHCHAIDNWNPSLSKTGTYLFYKVNNMVANVLVTQGARASATMILT